MLGVDTPWWRSRSPEHHERCESHPPQLTATPVEEVAWTEGANSGHGTENRGERNSSPNRSKAGRDGFRRWEERWEIGGETRVAGRRRRGSCGLSARSAHAPPLILAFLIISFSLR